MYIKKELLTFSFEIGVKILSRKESINGLNERKEKKRKKFIDIQSRIEISRRKPRGYRVLSWTIAANIELHRGATVHWGKMKSRQQSRNPIKRPPQFKSH